MGERQIAAKVERYCDRCRVDLNDDNTAINRATMHGAVQHRYIAVSAVARLFGRPPQVLSARITFCDGCWWEFDRLFCQGQAVRPAPGVRVQPMLEHGSSSEREGDGGRLAVPESVAIALGGMPWRRAESVSS